MLKTEKTAISPDTRIGTLLDDYPELEPVLMSLSPKFEKLKNPVLRKTVAKVATLKQIAKVGNIPLPELINTLREAAGMAPLPLDGHRSDTGTVSKGISPDKVSETLDIRESIAAGEQPISAVMKKLATLKKGETIKVIAPFEPAPLIDLAKEKGFAVHLQKEAENSPVHCYFSKPD